MCCESCCQCDRLFCITSFVGNLWMWCDIILDGLMVYFVYYKEYIAGEISYYFWILGAIFMLMPTVVAVITQNCRSLRSRSYPAYIGCGYACCVPFCSLKDGYTMRYLKLGE